MIDFASILTRIIGCIVTFVGMLVLFGWFHDIDGLKSGFISNISTMKVNTAICFVMLGIGLYFLSYHRLTRLRYRIVQGMTLATLTLSLLTLTQYLFVVDFGIDQLFLPDINPSSTTQYPGRMGEGTAISFSLLTIALFSQLSRSTRWVKWGQLLVIFVTYLNFLAFISHLFGVAPNYSIVTRISTTAPHTAILFLLSCLGLFILSSREGIVAIITSPLVGGVMARLLLPFSVFLPIFLNGVVLKGKRLGWYDTAFATTLETWILILIFSNLVILTAYWLNKLEKEQLEILAALQESSRLNIVIEASHDGIVTYTLQGVITSWNSGAEALFGYTEEEAIGMPISQLCPLEYQNELEKLIRQVQQGEGVDNYETIRQDKQGHLLDVSLSLALLKNENGRIIGISCIYRDITPQKQAERALAESERRFKAIFNSTFQFVGLLTPEGILLEANQTALDFAGLNREEVVNRPFWEIHWWTISPETQAELQQAIQKAAAGAFVRYDVDVWGVANQVITIDFSLKPLKDEQGKVILLIPEGRNISEYCRMKFALQDSEERFRNAFDYAVIGKALVGLNGKFMNVNASLCEIVGYSKEELQQLTFQEITHPDDLALDLAHVEQLLKGEIRSYSMEKRYFNKNGSIIWVLLNGSLVHDRNGYPAYFIAQIQDITERKATEQELRESQERLQLALKASGEGLWDWYINTGQVYVSPQWKEMLGYTEESLTVDLSTWKALIHPDDYPWVMERLNAHLSDHSISYEFEYRLRTQSGTWKWIANYGKVVSWDAKGKPQRMTGTHRDITDKKQAERDRMEKEKAILANQAKSAFIANMSHELRTPLNAILGFSQLMNRETSLNESQREKLGIINRSGEHLLALINDILALSKIDAGKIELNPTDFDLHRLIYSLTTMFEIKAQEKQLKLIVKQEKDLPQYIYSDEKIIRQVLINLLGNALKFTHQGSITLQLTAKQENSDQTLLEISVIDTGEGMKTEEIEHIFEDFVQTDAGKRSNQGTGLGLAISHKLISLMGGNIEVNSQIGQGSTFKVIFLVKISNNSQFNSGLPSNYTLPRLAPDQPIYRILIAEDNQNNRQFLAELLQSVGFQVKEAVNGKEAIEITQSWQPHLIWMDMRMPIMAGKEATQQIKKIKDPNFPIPVIIALTASVFEEERREILSSGCDDFVRKPFPIKMILEKIQQYLPVTYLDEVKSPDLPLLPQSYHLTPDLLQKMPQKWLKQLKQAADCLDDQTIQQLIREIPDDQAYLAQALRQLAENFEFEEISSLFD